MATAEAGVAAPHASEEHMPREEVFPDVKQIQVNRQYTKRSLGHTFGLFIERLRIMPQSFSGKGVQLYIIQ